MSIPNEYDLLLLGNLIIDEVYSISDWDGEEGTSNLFKSHRTSIGGIGNLIRALSGSQLEILVEASIGHSHREMVENALSKVNKILHHAKKSSEALILANIQSSERTSFVNWSAPQIHLSEDIKAKWAHISYLDTSLPFDFEDLRKRVEIISADLCLSNPTRNQRDFILSELHNLDVLFVSKSELRPLLMNSDFTIGNFIRFINHHRLKNLVYHSKYQTILVRGNGCHFIHNDDIIDNVNVLGAGDVFSANFIWHQLINPELSMNKSIEFAHGQTLNYLIENN